METEALTVQSPGGELQPISVDRLKARIQAIQQVMKDLMKDGTHFGVIPGTKKPSLWKPGAELIAATFGIRLFPEVVEERVNEEEAFYRIRVVARNTEGDELGAAEGVCSTREKKYRWRRPTHIKEWENAQEHRRQTVWDQNGNETKQVRQEVGDVQHTIQAMADKRGMVAVVRKVTACSDIFEQELEDDDNPDEKAAAKEAESPVAAPQRASASEGPPPAGPTSDGRAVQIATIKKVKSGVSPDDKPWNLYAVKTRDGMEYVTFDQKVALQAEELIRSGESVVITSEANPSGRSPKIVKIEAAA